MADRNNTERKMTRKDLTAWMNQHLVPIKGRSGFWTVKKTLKVFKKIYTYKPCADQQISLRPHNLETSGTVLACGNNDFLTRSSWDRTQAIANLLIPVGTEIYIDPYRAQDREVYRLKMRAELAEIHSIVRVEDKKQVIFGRAGYEPGYTYLSPLFIGAKSIAKPTIRWSRSSNQCESGIHFYITLSAALNH